MSLWSRLFGRRDTVSWGERKLQKDSGLLDTLVSDPGTIPMEMDRRPEITPWSAARLGTIFADFAHEATPTRLAEARLARQCLSKFWLSAPIDALELLYGSAVGQSYRQMISGALASQPLLRDEESWRDHLSERLQSGFDRPEMANVLLAVMPYFRRGKMKVRNCEQNLPAWLLEDYASLFEPELLPRLRQPSPLERRALAPAAGSTAGPATGSVGVEPERLPLPQLSGFTGAQALQLTASEEFLTRLNGLVNLFEIDPDDGAIRQELGGYRRQLGQIWLDTPDDQLQSLFESTFGDLYRKFLRSGYAGTHLTEEDRQLRAQLAQYVRNMTRPRAAQAVLASLPFYPPGKIGFAGGEQFMPQWLLGALPSLYVKS
ncbi:hypothetical protein VB738_13615 [Cyanobium gracile UHCC 0139]|uniref:Uncharacterized protein n=1 Tax=Cyanobium gracile UHCC 0139 TaxID=3110308 RepID=A0ABU5RWX7_9CYAN|nr:hypothetical protein [Cyanobium gracile]MEA5392295.1 hypothetical protein [Cyanobium gracile UHCC 0139]